MRGYFLFFTFILFQNSNAQSDKNDTLRSFIKKLYFSNQRAVDRATSGIGIERSSILYGANYQPITFNKIDLRANVFEFRVGIANSNYYSSQTNLTYNTQVTNWAVGLNYPISVLGIGRANSTKGVRLLPFFSTDFGRSSFKDVSTNGKLASAFHLSLSPGYRIKIPYLIIDLRLNSTWNFLTQTKYHENMVTLTSNGDIVKEHSFRSFTFTPSVSIILDGLFTVFNPKNSRVSGEMAVVDKTTKKEFYTGETRNSVTGKMEKDGLYKTETTYEYHQEAVSLPISDIGTFIGIGPRLVFRPESDSSYRMPSLMGGFAIHARRKMLSFDVNIDKGTVGYSSQVKPNREIIKTDTRGKGNFNVTNVTANVGIDIGPLLLGFLGIVTTRDGETPYFNICTGFIYGYSFMGSYSYNDIATGESYQNYFKANPDKSTMYNNAASNKSGIVRGLYIGSEVGAVGFRYEYTTYKNAPLAKCSYFTISYKFPLLRSNRILKK